MEIHGNPWRIHGESMGIYGNQWNPWESMEIHGFLKEASLRRLPEGGFLKEASRRRLAEGGFLKAARAEDKRYSRLIGVDFLSSLFEQGEGTHDTQRAS